MRRPSPSSPHNRPPRLAGLLLLAALLAASLPGCRPGRGTPASPAGDASPLKISVSEDGLYALDAAALRRAGWDTGALDPARLSLFGPGGEQSLLVEGRGEGLRLLFAGRVSSSPYTRENIYWLVAEQDRARIAAWTAELEAQPPEEQPLLPLQDLPPESYPARFRQEQNALYLPQAGGGERWFWARLSAPGAWEAVFSLPSLAAGGGRLRIELWAGTEAPAAPDHRLLLSLNGQALPEQAWDGIGRRTLELPLPAGLLREGENRVRLEAPGLEGAPAEVVHLNWVELLAPRPYQAVGDRLEFTAPGGPAVLSGFSGPPRLCAQGGPGSARPEFLTAVDGLQDLGGGRWRLEARAGARYLAAGPGGFLAPLKVEAAGAQPDLRDETLQAAYLALGPQDLLDALQPLLAYRAGGGLSVLALPLEAVYDQFNGGLPEPEAVRRLLQHASQHWREAPRFLLLVGDASYDPRGYLAHPEANLLPVYLVPTRYGGETGSDLPFTLLDGDALPDLALGRLPARSPAQVRAYVEKVLAYEGRRREGPASVLAVADGQDPLFEAEARAFLELFPPAMRRDLYAPPPGAQEAREELRRRFGQGYGLIAYFGHGGLRLWSRDQLFTAADAAALGGGGRPPVSLQMTCLTGLFTHPEEESLAESLLWQPGGGAAAVLAPTSLTLPADQGPLSRALVQALLSAPGARLGEALLQARRTLAAGSPEAADVLHTFLLFGDPALSLDLVSGENPVR